jgi:hypothetical protein
MVVLDSFTLTLTPELILAEQGRSAGKGPLSPAAMQLCQKMIEQVRALAKPVALLDCFDVQAIEHDRLVLSNGRAFRSHLVIEQLAHARQVAVGICTIGAGVEAESRQAFADGEGLAGYLLDRAGSLAVASVAQSVGEHVERLATDRGLEASLRIAPGSADCTLEDQRVVFDLLPAKDIGVRLTDSCLMVPSPSRCSLGWGTTCPARTNWRNATFARGRTPVLMPACTRHMPLRKCGRLPSASWHLDPCEES